MITITELQKLADTEEKERNVWDCKIDKRALEVSNKMDRDQAACLIKDFYLMQDNRMRAAHQHRQLEKRGDKGDVLSYASKLFQKNEDHLALLICLWGKDQKMAQWAMQNVGIGKIMSAGLVAHIDVTKSPHLSSLWAFAGFPGDSEVKKWKKGEKRPFNANLKKLCFKIGESFVKNQNRQECYYGKLFAERKKLEWERNLNGAFSEYSKKQLTFKDWKKDSTAKLFYSGQLSPSKVREMIAGNGVPLGVKPTQVGDEIPMLPPAHIHARARRYAVKRFLAHYWMEAYKQTFHKDPPPAYVFAKLGHTHIIESPVPSLAKENVKSNGQERVNPDVKSNKTVRAKPVAKPMTKARTIKNVKTKAQV